MRILAIDTSTRAQSLALTTDREVVARRITQERSNHSESLLRNIDDMLVQAKWDARELDLVCVGLGPGTFTGLRVGLATAKAIARSADAELVGVDSLAATANPVTSLHEGPVVAIADARRGEVYLGIYHRDGDDLVCDRAPGAVTPEKVSELVRVLDASVVIVGTGLRAYPELASWSAPHIRTLPSPWDAPSSVSIAWLGARLLAERGADDLAALEPNYVRPSDAEMNFGRPDSQKSVLT